jgi:hypothetical protein
MMKKIFVVFFLFIFANSYSQEFLGFENIQFDDRIDYAISEPAALRAANLILETSVDSKEPSRLKALKFLVMWMEGTPDYVFNLEEDIPQLTHSSNKLLSVYMACLVKFVLENKPMASDQNEVRFNAVNSYLDYCLKSGTGVKEYKQLKKYKEIRDRGELRKYLKQ